MTVADFPNLFMIHGPGSALGALQHAARRRA